MEYGIHVFITLREGVATVHQQGRLEARNAVLLQEYPIHKLWCLILSVIIFYCVLAVPFMITFLWNEEMHPTLYNVEVQPRVVCRGPRTV